MTPAKVSCLICATPRCGSNLLCEGLRRSRLGGRPEEFFSASLLSTYRELWKVSDDFLTYIRKAVEIGTTGNGVFAAKIMWSDAQQLFTQLRAHYGVADVDLAQTHERLSGLLPNLHYLYIERKEILAQAVSYAKALQNDVWIERIGHSATASDKLEYSRSQISYLLKEISDQSLSWNTYLAATGAPVKRISYEDFSENIKDTACDVLDFLGIAMPAEAQFTKGFMRKQSDGINAEWIMRYKSGN